MANKLIYLDNNATTPADPRVVDKMIPYFHEIPGNAASRSHRFGWQAEEAVKQARLSIADLIDVDAKEIVFTSGATESDNLGIKGVFELYHRSGNHIITVKTEHPAVLDTCERIEKMGGVVTYLDVDKDGLVDLKALEKTFTDKTILVCIMWANNETGVIQPMQEIGKICNDKGVLLMSDATQAVGKIEVKPKEVGVHIMAFTAHKMYGPKGVGALYVCQSNPRVKLMPQIDGGGHEKNMRSGTLNVPGIVGMGEAAKIAKEETDTESERLSELRNKIENALLTIEGCTVNGAIENRLPHVSNLSILYVEGEALMLRVNNHVAISSGSACTSASLEPSHVLMAMGMNEDEAHCSIRISLGRFTTEEDIDIAIEKISEAIKYLRSVSPVWELYKDGML